MSVNRHSGILPTFVIPEFCVAEYPESKQRLSSRFESARYRVKRGMTGGGSAVLTGDGECGIDGRWYVDVFFHFYQFVRLPCHSGILYSPSSLRNSVHPFIIPEFLSPSSFRNFVPPVIPEFRFSEISGI